MVSVKRADLVDLDEDAVGNPLVDPFRSRLTFVTNRSSPTSWHFPAKRLGEQLPTLPIVLGKAVFDRADGVLGRESGQEFDHRGGVEFLSLEHIFFRLGVEKLRRGRVEGQLHLIPGVYFAFSIALRISSMASGVLLRSGANPPSSPTDVLNFFSERTDLSE